MTLDTLIMFAGAVVAVVPFLGFPIGWEHLLFFVAGVCIVGLGIVIRRQKDGHAAAPKVSTAPSSVSPTRVTNEPQATPFAEQHEHSTHSEHEAA